MIKKVAILTLTKGSYDLGKKLKRKLVNYEVSLYGLEKNVEFIEENYLNQQFKEGFAAIFSEYDAMICVMATGIVVRHLASLVQDKRHDPAVVVMDEKGKFAISLLSGHIGGGNELTNDIANTIGAQPVITTATDVQNVTAIDLMAKSLNGWYQDFKKTTKHVNYLLATHKKVALFDEENRVTDLRGLELINTLETKEVTNFEAVIVVSTKQRLDLASNCFQVVPKEFVLGMGAKRDTPYNVIKEEFSIFCDLHNIHPQSIKQIVSIDLKKDEQGIIAFSNELAVPFDTYTKEELEPSSLKYPQSDFVKSVVGIGNVALSSADYATNGKVLTERYGHNGVTFALGKG
ncbi:cobalt-precorrin 5A hydrolase [Vagococcus sp.]|uniref:cobalt-precorrin 5A hydrolase n=1 Tax=Vagococcus sp. TaxID=1933889 RepID=UPI002FCAF5F4